MSETKASEPRKLPVDFKYYHSVAGTLNRLLRARYKYVCLGGENLPAHGGAILAATHVSFLDVLAVGAATFPRPMAFVARDSLARVPIVGRIIRHMGPILIRRGTGDSGALREMTERASSGELVVIFPEGTRSHDGRMQPLRPGILLPLRRARAPLIPVGIAGTFDVFPRSRRLPRWSGRIVASFGKPISILDRDDPLEPLARAMEAELRRAGDEWSRITGKPFLQLGEPVRSADDGR